MAPSSSLLSFSGVHESCRLNFAPRSSSTFITTNVIVFRSTGQCRTIHVGHPVLHAWNSKQTNKLVPFGFRAPEPNAPTLRARHPCGTRSLSLGDAGRLKLKLQPLDATSAVIRAAGLEPIRMGDTYPLACQPRRHPADPRPSNLLAARPRCTGLFLRICVSRSFKLIARAASALCTHQSRVRREGPESSQRTHASSSDPAAAVPCRRPASALRPWGARTFASALVERHLEGERITKVAELVSEQAVRVTFEDGATAKFHKLWLRDHCRCEHCMHPETQQRQLDTASIPMDAPLQRLEVTHAGGAVAIDWNAPVRGTRARPASSTRSGCATTRTRWKAATPTTRPRRRTPSRTGSRA